MPAIPPLNWIAVSSQPPLQSSTALSTTKPQLPFLITTLYGLNRKHRSQKFLYCCLHIRCCGNWFTEPLHSNECLPWLHYSSLQVSCHNIKPMSITSRPTCSVCHFTITYNIVPTEPIAPCNTISFKSRLHGSNQ
jgi:hypothetical protein